LLPIERLPTLAFQLPLFETLTLRHWRWFDRHWMVVALGDASPTTIPLAWPVTLVLFPK